MENYLTIGEFAKLRNVNINSLLYYEKLGILPPAYIDPNTKYRYYAPEQLSTLDIILLCIKLNIPLKELNQYQAEDSYWQKKMLEDGKRLAENKISQMLTDLKKIEYTLKCQEEQNNYAACSGIYQREIPLRLFIAEEYFGDLNNITHFGQISTELFEYAESKGFPAILPTGFMFAFNKNKIRQFLFYEILPAQIEDEKVIKIPAGAYSCLQIKFDPDMNYSAFLSQHFGTSSKRIAIVTNLIRDKLQINDRYNEIQVLDGYTIPDDRA